MCRGKALSFVTKIIFPKNGDAHYNFSYRNCEQKLPGLPSTVCGNKDFQRDSQELRCQPGRKKGKCRAYQKRVIIHASSSLCLGSSGLSHAREMREAQ